MQLKLDDRWIEKLAGLPESGMGYQRVRVRLRDGRVVAHGLVFNAEILEVGDEAGAFTPTDIADIELEAHAAG
jgi:hypothetical protein